MEFKGRLILGSNFSGVAFVSRKVLNLEKSFNKSIVSKKPNLIAKDKSNVNLYKRDLKDKIVVVPSIKSGELDGLILLELSKKLKNPSAILIAEKIDESLIAPLMLIPFWTKAEITIIDGLGREFLENIESGDVVRIEGDSVFI